MFSAIFDIAALRSPAATPFRLSRCRHRHSAADFRHAAAIAAAFDYFRWLLSLID
jgi:hypothetical protein